ncbi:hypothetical protein ACQEV9_45355 [Streptomyces chartreusis]|uniref:hypothetical protein n=1 Tax=Streptomyces chartreusis TaxID=1969 RepID=UPI003D8B05D6
MAGRERRCAHSSRPLRATARSDAQFCSKACKAAERRWRQHFLEAVAIGLWYTQGVETEHVVRCPACGRRSRSATATAETRSTARTPADRPRTGPAAAPSGHAKTSRVTVPGTPSRLLTSTDILVEMAAATRWSRTAAAHGRGS